MALKDKAIKTKSSGSLAKKAQASKSVGNPKKAPEIEDRTTLPAVTGQAPPPPPPLIYLSFFSNIPALRKQTPGG